MAGDGTTTARARSLAVTEQLSADEWRRLVAGDKAVFKRVYLAHVGLIHYVGIRAGLAPGDAEDVVQEVFTRLYQRAGEIRGADKVKAWLVACARNLAVDRLRAARRLTAMDGAGDAQLDKGATVWASDPDRALRELELKLVGELLARVASTPGGETLRQFYAEGLSTKEIARRNGEALSTVTTRLSRLRVKFKEEFRRHIESLREREGG